MRIVTFRFIAPVFCGFSLLSLPVCAPPGDVPRTQAEILRSPRGCSEPGAAAYRDLPPGTYRFTVQSLSGIPTGYKDKVKLAPGTQTYLEIQWGPSWNEGQAGGETFYVRTLSQELGKAYYGSMRYVGPART
jgi:hypothetical protein